MRWLRLWVLVLLAGTLVGLYVALRNLGLMGMTVLAKVLDVPNGHQEIAWINTATSGSSWERFVAGVDRVQQKWPELRVDKSNAFPDQTTAVPEIALEMEGCPDKLWIRWYKLTSDIGTEQWINALAERDPPPLALIGGGSSDRARELAKALRNRESWRGPAPLLAITTATADKVRLDEEHRAVFTPPDMDQSKEPWHDLMDVYPGRAFRFCFTNSQMAEAVVDFVWSQPQLRPYALNLSVSLGAVPQAVSGDALGATTWLTMGAQPFKVYAIKWLDDPYSIDLAERFRHVFESPDKKPNLISIEPLPYSVGGFSEPNPPEATAAGLMIADILGTDQRPLLVLPAVDRPARRFLHALAASAPFEVRNMVVLSGDSISFNTICRDRDIAWNTQDMPIPLVFFSHQNPVDWPASATSGTAPANVTATDDELLNADIVRILLNAAFPKEGDRRPRLLADADQLRDQIHRRKPPFFEANGNRRGGSGEYVVFLQPNIEGGRVLPSSTIEVWRRQDHERSGALISPRWVMKKRLLLETETIRDITK